MVKKIVLSVVAVIVVAVAGILVFASTKPDTFRIERSATINAPAEKIFPLVSDLHGWSSWSPWERMDPNMKRTYSGPTGGVGAIYEWDGNDQVGQGRMEIVEATAPSNVAIKLNFIKPFQAENRAEFKLVPQGETTNVTWSMAGQNTFPCKVMQTFCDMDAMCGKEFDAGLANLKTATEKNAVAESTSSGKEAAADKTVE